jgi:hypothetical protein
MSASWGDLQSLRTRRYGGHGQDIALFADLHRLFVSVPYLGATVRRCLYLSRSNVRLMNDETTSSS